MDLQILQKENNKIIFLLKGVDYTYANTIRRTMLSRVPSLAIKEIYFTKNSSALFNEMIAHRLGLIPLLTDLQSYELQETLSEKEQHSPRAELHLSLKAEGPITVYASDLKFQDSAVKAVYGKIPIVKLLKGQELEFEAIATLGRGETHTKYSPCLVYYKAAPKISIEKVKNAEQVVKSCPVDVFELEGKQVKVKDLYKCHLCLACTEEADPEGAVRVESSEKDFIFTIESWGQLDPKIILEEALNDLDTRAEQLKEVLGKAK